MTRTAFKAWLKAHKLSNVAAAKLLDVTPATVSRWLAGKRKLPKWLPIVLAHAAKRLPQ